MSLSVSESVEPAVRVARGASYLLLQGIVINIMGVFYFVFATRLLPTVADFGRISTVNIFAVLVVSVGSLGFQLQRRGSLRSMSPQSRKGRPASSIKRF